MPRPVVRRRGTRHPRGSASTNAVPAAVRNRPGTGEPEARSATRFGPIRESRTARIRAQDAVVTSVAIAAATQAPAVNADGCPRRSCHRAAASTANAEASTPEPSPRAAAGSTPRAATTAARAGDVRVAARLQRARSSVTSASTVTANRARWAGTPERRTTSAAMPARPLASKGRCGLSGSKEAGHPSCQARSSAATASTGASAPRRDSPTRIRRGEEDGGEHDQHLTSAGSGQGAGAQDAEQGQGPERDQRDVEDARARSSQRPRPRRHPEREREVWHRSPRRSHHEDAGQRREQRRRRDGPRVERQRVEHRRILRATMRAARAEGTIWTNARPACAHLPVHGRGRRSRGRDAGHRRRRVPGSTVDPGLRRAHSRRCRRQPHLGDRDRDGQLHRQPGPRPGQHAAGHGPRGRDQHRRPRGRPGRVAPEHAAALPSLRGDAGRDGRAHDDAVGAPQRDRGYLRGSRTAGRAAPGRGHDLRLPGAPPAPGPRRLARLRARCPASSGWAEGSSRCPC